MVWKHFVIFVAFFLTTCGSREVEEDYSKLFSDKDLWKEIAKRLDKKYQVEEVSDCSPEISYHKIIQTNASLEEGAKFLGNPKVSSEEECKNECCSRGDCDLAVYRMVIDRYKTSTH